MLVVEKCMTCQYSVPVKRGIFSEKDYHQRRGIESYKQMCELSDVYVERTISYVPHGISLIQFILSN